MVQGNDQISCSMQLADIGRWPVEDLGSCIETSGHGKLYSITVLIIAAPCPPVDGVPNHEYKWSPVGILPQTAKVAVPSFLGVGNSSRGITR